MFKTIVSFCFIFLFCVAIAQSQEQIIKQIDESTQEDVTVLISEHVTVYPAEDPNSRDIQCSCWLEPDDTYTLFTNANMDDGSTGNIALPFDVELFGETYSSFWLNINGHITFDDIPSGFYVDADFPDGRVTLAPCHSDIDLSCATCGEIYYKITEDAVYINWVDVGHFNATSDQVQRFQLVFTSNNSELLGDGNNVQFCYQDMQWTLTDSSDFLELGASGGNAANNIEFGVFQLENSAVYDGPFGDNDGVDWLDYKAITFNSAQTNAQNTPPISVGSIECDTIVLCQNDTELINFEFLAPEQNENVSVAVNDGGFSNLTLNTTEGSYATADLMLSSDGVAPGFYEIIITATDDGSPAASTETTVIVEVIAETIPELDIYFEDEIVTSVTYCAGEDDPFLSGTDGFDCYIWSTNSHEQTDQFSQGIYELTAFWMGCEAEAGPISVIQLPVLNPEVEILNQFLCEGETTEIILQDPELYENPLWSVIQNNGAIISTDLTNDTITVSSGLYELNLTDENGCPALTQVAVIEQITNIPSLNFSPLCNDTELCWSGGWTDPESCIHQINLLDSELDTWEGANLSVFIDGTGPFNFSILNAAGFTPTGVQPFHGQAIEYFWQPGLDDDDIDIQLFNSDGQIVFDTTDGDVLTEGLILTQIANCGVNEIPGTWSSSCADGVFENPNTFNTCYTAPEGFLGECQLTFDSDICQEEISFTVIFSATPEVEAFDYLNQCGEVVIEPMYSDPLPPDADFNWSPNLNDGFPTATVTQSVSYTIQVTTVNCGNAEASGLVQITPTPAPELENASLCEGQNAVLDSDMGTGIDITWEGPGVNGLTSSSVTAMTAGTYTVTGTNDCGTESSTAIITEVLTPSITQFPFDTLVCLDESLLLDPNWNTDGPITWVISYTDTTGTNVIEPQSETGETFLFESTFIPGDAASNSVVVLTSYSNACGTSQSELVIGMDACFVTAPNVITPDNDNNPNGAYAGGLNEGWNIIGIDGVSNVDVKIYDRWGTFVYENSNYQNTNPWRGNHKNGDELVEGVYFYVIKTPLRDEELTGTVTILRK